MYDCTMINDELDMLEIRLNILYPFIEKFVIVESNRTHSGRPKEFNFLKNKDRFEKFMPKIIFLQYNGFEITPGVSPWGNENFQRNMILDSLNIAKPEDDMLFVSDVDEIPKPEKLFEARCIVCKTNMPVSLAMYNCMYFMNYVADLPYRGPYLYKPEKAKEVHDIFHCDRHSPSDFRWHMCSVGNEGDFHTILEAGWHFSTMGGIEAIRKKLASYAHVEFNTPELRSDEHLLKCMDEGIPYFEKLFNFQKDPVRYTKRDISFLPAYIQFNLDRFKSYIV